MLPRKPHDDYYDWNMRFTALHQEAQGRVKDWVTVLPEFKVMARDTPLFTVEHHRCILQIQPL